MTRQPAHPGCPHWSTWGPIHKLHMLKNVNVPYILVHMVTCTHRFLKSSTYKRFSCPLWPYSISSPNIHMCLDIFFFSLNHLIPYFSVHHSWFSSVEVWHSYWSLYHPFFPSGYLLSAPFNGFFFECNISTFVLDFESLSPYTIEMKWNKFS